MKRVLALSLILAIIAIACSKSKFETTPTVEIKSISPDVAVKGNIVSLKVRVTDKEGDLQDSVLFVSKTFDLAGVPISIDTARYSLETLKFPDKRDIEVEVQFLYGEIGGNVPYIYIPLASDDQKFSVGAVVIDKADHRSEYVESGQITLKKL
jgi:hypothetical protein